MNFLDSILGDDGCSVEGTVSRNPVSLLIDRVLDTHIGIDGQVDSVSISNVDRTMEFIHPPSSSASLVSTSAETLAHSMTSTNIEGVGGAVNYQQQMLMMQQQQNFFTRFIEEQQQIAEAHQNAVKLKPGREALKQRDMADSAEIRRVYAKQMQDIVQGYNEIWNNQQSAHYTATKAGYDEAWGRLTGKLESEEYSYRKENPFDEKGNCFELGMKLFADGDIENAICAFESATRELVDDAESWRMLGLCHSEVDDDKQAILALRRAVDLDPYHLEALVALGTSYVNEGDSFRALESLQSWVKHNPKFMGLSVTPDEYSDGTLTDQLQQLVTAAKAWAPGDVDVNVVEGVLYNATEDYSFACESFNNALSSNPEAYSIWNKVTT
jgi:tetratricopeptide (TPR) repeat protein